MRTNLAAGGEIKGRSCFHFYRGVLPQLCAVDGEFVSFHASTNGAQQNNRDAAKSNLIPEHG
jgi:hypothetical protein